MKLGIIGVEDSGRATIFGALTQRGDEAGGREAKVGMVRVPDERIDKLSAIFKPKKTIYAQVEFTLPAEAAGKEAKDKVWAEIRGMDALIVVARNFGPDRKPLAEIKELVSEMVFADFMVAEKRLERLALDAKRGRPGDPKEIELLETCKALLEKDQPLRSRPDLAAAPELRGFAFLSGKPMLALFTNDDDDPNPPAEAEAAGVEWLAVRGKLEAEIAAMSPEERDEFLKEYGITESAMDRVIRASYAMMGLMSFFTVGEDEVRAWTIKRGTPAVEAAGEIHSDIQKGFIRAEVVSYTDFMAAGNMAEAKKHAKLRLEGKTYEVLDGDIINFRFNV